MKKSNRHSTDTIRPEYDFSSMKGGIRGKHYERYKEGTNLVVLKPDVAEAFPTEEAVNEALRGILTTARAVRETGGLSDRALRSTSRSRRTR
jgi:hypothetical protein